MLPRVTSGARPTALAALLYGLLALAFVSPALVPGKTLAGSDYLWDATPWKSEKPSHIRTSGSNYEMADASTQFLPFMRYTRERLPDAPLWNPHQMLGRPFIGNAQSAVFSPFSTPAYVVPFWRSLALIAALKLLVAAFGTFLLGRALGMRWAAAFAAGCVFAFGIYMVIWLPAPLSSVFVWIPWLLLAVEGVVRRPGALSTAGLSAVVALQFVGGHPESSFHALAAASLFFLWRLWQRGRRERRELLARVAAAGAALALGTALAGVAVVPLVEALAQSADVAERGDDEPVQIQAKYVFSVLMHDYWGRTTQAPRSPFSVDRGFYAGLLPLFLAIVALTLRPTAGRVATAAGGLAAVGMTIGEPGPIYDLVIELPGFAQVHNTRLVIIFVLAVAMLAGWGLHDLLGKPDRRRLVAALGVIGASVLVPLVAVVASRPLDGDLPRAIKMVWGLASAPIDYAGETVVVAERNISTVILSGVIAFAMFAFAGLALLVLRWRGLVRPRTFAVLAVGLIVVDLFRAGIGWNPAIDRDDATQPVTPALELLRSHTPQRFAAFAPDNRQIPLTPNSGMPFGLYDARGYDYPVVRRFNAFWERYVARNPGFRPVTIVASPSLESMRALSLVGVRNLVQDPTEKTLRLPGLRLVYNRPDARVYDNTRALPRAWVVGEQRVVDGSESALRAIGDPDWDPRRVAILEDPVSRLEGGSGGDARILDYEPERVVVDVVSRGRGLLVLSDIHYPGWKARVDGREVGIERANYLLRGVSLEDGRHRVEFVYKPASWRVGWILSLAALLVLGGLLAVGLRGRRLA